MRCIICQKDKLSKEFPFDSITDDCQHPPSHCLRCIIKHLSDLKLACPYTGCECSVDHGSRANLLEQYKNEMDQLYPPIETSGVEDVDHVDISSAERRINVTTLTGDSASFPFDPLITVEKFKLQIFERLKVTPDKQQLMYGDLILEGYKDGVEVKLQEYNIKPFTTVHLMVLLYAIPQHFNHVIFDLFWGYPARGCDYLDASCLIFNGKSFIGTVDYSQRQHSTNAIWHSGDVMDNVKRQGHHTIEVRLKDLPTNITRLYFTLSAWNSPTIAHFPNPSLKFYEASNKTKDLCKTTFMHARNSQAVVMCSVSRTPSGQWMIFESGALSAGNAKNYNPLVSTIISLP